MSMQGFKNLLEEKVRKPLRKRPRLPKPLRSNKRLKTGEDEDDWCDALNHLSVDSDSDEEYFDALEKQVTSKSLPTETERTMAQARKPSTKKHRYPAQSCTPSTSGLGSRTKYEEKIDQRQSSQGHSNSTGYPFDRKDLSAPITFTCTETEPKFRSGRPSTATSSSSGTNVHVGPKQSTTIDDQPPLQNPKQDYTDKGGISDSNLEKLTKSLMADEYSARSLGRELGFNPTEVYRYCGYGGTPKDSSGILRMLRVWRDKAPDKEQLSGLLEALKKANLKHMSGDLRPQEGKLEKRKVTVTLMTSWHLSSIEGLKKKLINLRRVRPDLIEAVKVLSLPFSGIQRYAFTEDVDIMVLCHSIVNRRFGITNVTDSLYDEFLDYCNKTLGKERIVVIAHDFRQEKNEVRAVTMNTFKHTQWSTFEKAGLVMICGMMDKTPEIQEKDWKSLVKFLEDASKSTPTIADISQTTLPKINTSDTKQKLNKSEKDKKGKNIFGTRSSSGPVGTRSRKPTIYICTSWGLYSVKGLKEKLKTLSEKLFSRYEIKEQDLPYSRLEDFKFPPEVDRTDAMILCHSVQNRGFSITDVENSIYDEFLKYCNRVFGKDHMGVIVHDFDKPEILKVHLETIHRSQPATYKLVDFVAVAGQLDVPDVKLCHDESTSLETFVGRLRETKPKHF